MPAVAEAPQGHGIALDQFGQSLQHGLGTVVARAEAARRHAQARAQHVRALRVVRRHRGERHQDGAAEPQIDALEPGDRAVKGRRHRRTGQFQRIEERPLPDQLVGPHPP